MKIGIIGGSGLYEFDGIENVEKVKVDTPFGKTSDDLVLGEYQGHELVFLARHGKGHRILPGDVPYRANIFALKSQGVQWIISVSAVGSLREDIRPGEFVLPDQFVDRTQGRPSTFFGQGIVGHIGFADPVCETLREHLRKSVEATGVRCHSSGTYVCIQGPAFSTRAESNLYRSWGMDIIGMTAIPEAKLAREAQLHFSTIGLVTDYDCWHTSEAEVSADAVLKTVKQNAQNVQRVLTRAIPKVHELQPNCVCARSLQGAIITNASLLTDAMHLLAPLMGDITSVTTPTE